MLGVTGFSLLSIKKLKKLRIKIKNSRQSLVANERRVFVSEFNFLGPAPAILLIAVLDGYQMVVEFLTPWTS